MPSPFSVLTSKIFGGLSIVLLLAVAVLWWRMDHWHKVADHLAKQAGQVIIALRLATDNPKADWETAPGQIYALGDSNRRLKGEIANTNRALDDMAAEAVRLRKRAEDLQEIARKAEAQRRAAYARLSNMAATPGQRSDCMMLIREAEEALNIVKEAGL